VDLAIFLPDIINERKTKWGSKSSCDLGVYIPVCQSFFGIIMATMFVMCGRGGKSKPDSFLPQPWRIVTPALVFFLVMTILSIVYLFNVQGGMNSFCQSLEEVIPDISCDIAMNRYMEVSYEKVVIPPSIHRRILSALNIITLMLWLASLLVLLARILFVIDFQLIRVTVKSVEFETANEISTLDVERNGIKDPEAPLATTEC
jgi:hypothetical protein